MARKAYPDSFKCDAVKLIADKGYSLAKASEATGVPIATLSSWKNNLLPQDQAELKAELSRMTKRVKELEMERDILKKRPPSLPRRANEIRFYPRTPGPVVRGHDVPRAESQPQRVLCIRAPHPRKA